ncbi:MAG: hypothetical protein N2554_10725, partial [Fimbriimonadales bacterium]|nr:hypothetical protein [Fimbriimonadales bacterium]
MLLFGLIWSPKMTCWMALDSGATATTPSLALLPSELTQPNDLARVAQFQQDELPMLQYRDGVWRGARLGEG